MDEIMFMAALNENSDDEEALILHVLHDEENLGRRADLYGRFNINSMFESECKNLFRFSNIDIVRLTRALNIPDLITTSDRISVSGVEGFCIVRRRLVYPNRLCDLEPFFGLCSQAISSVCNHTLNLVLNNKGHLLETLQNNLHFLNYAKSVRYSEAIHTKGCPIKNCWGFIDGTARPICRPSINQENYYSGHKRFHCVKYQGVMCPDGLIISLKGAHEGRRHDAGIFRESGLYNELQQHTVFPNENSHFVLYGDLGYGLRELLLRPYTQYEIRNNPNRLNFNNIMSTMRISVEWGFGKILQLFAFVDLKKNQKILLQDVEMMYKVAVLLTNCHTCLYGSKVTSYFGINPPTLEEYLNL